MKTLSDESKGEDFIFSWQELLDIVMIEPRAYSMDRNYINGLEFTSRIPSGTKSNYDDAVIVAKNIIFNNDSKHVISEKSVVPFDVYLEVEKEINGSGEQLENEKLKEICDRTCDRIMESLQ